jgi:8-oxo-dGTP pyrophosphatase MutT (NUDIX family)
MPEELTARARAVVDRDPSWVVPAPRDSATVVLLRDVADGFEVFVLRRVSSMAFAAGMHVFPGGVVEPGDVEVPWHPGADPDPTRLSASPGVARALVAAAVRETFEECGALLATDGAGRAPGADEAARVGVLDGSIDFASLLRERGLAVDGQALQAWDHWVTPEVEPRRYDTRFFVAALPPGEHAVDVGGEADRVRWVRPELAVSECVAGRMPMLPRRSPCWSRCARSPARPRCSRLRLPGCCARSCLTPSTTGQAGSAGRWSTSVTAARWARYERTAPCAGVDVLVAGRRRHRAGDLRARPQPRTHDARRHQHLGAARAGGPAGARARPRS